MHFEVGASEKAGTLEVSALWLGGRGYVPWRKQHKMRTFRMRATSFRRMMSWMEEMNRSCKPEMCSESASSVINHFFVKSYICSVSRNLCLIFTPKSEISEKSGNIVQVKEVKGHSRNGCWGPSEVNLVNSTGFRTS